jgi:hypothetical protein
MNGAIVTLWLRTAKEAVKRQIQARGLKLAQFSSRELCMMAEDYFV